MGMRYTGVNIDKNWIYNKDPLKKGIYDCRRIDTENKKDRIDATCLLKELDIIGHQSKTQLWYQQRVW